MTSTDPLSGSSKTGSGPQDQSDVRRWWVYSEEDDGQVITAVTAQAAVEKWAASEWSDVEDGMTIEAYDVGLIKRFTARQMNEIGDDDFDTRPEFGFQAASDESGASA